MFNSHICHCIYFLRKIANFRSFKLLSLLPSHHILFKCLSYRLLFPRRQDRHDDHTDIDAEEGPREEDNHAAAADDDDNIDELTAAAAAAADSERVAEGGREE